MPLKKKAPKITTFKNRAIKNKFVLNVGDEGAILTHYMGGKLSNRLYVDSPFSSDMNLMEKLLSTYPSHPVYLLVDVIEQNYSQQVLPPVSSLGVKKQVERRIKRDFQDSDFNNYISMGRSKEGRKDWNFLFVSLSNTEPFSKWLEFILMQDNPYKGTYLLPVEAQNLVKDLNLAALEKFDGEWEVLVLHDKIGGFRIIAFQGGKVIFTRLIQQLVGDNIPEVVVGNLEQEVSNTIEYIKRIGFRSEADSKITIIAAGELLDKVDNKRLKFGRVDMYTPAQAATKLGIAHAVNEKDRYADVVCAAHFAAHKPLLRFDSPHTKKLFLLQNARKAIYALGILGSVALIGIGVSDYLGSAENRDKLSSLEMKRDAAQSSLAVMKEKDSALPQNVSLMLDVMDLHKSIDYENYALLSIISDVTSSLPEQYTIDNLVVKIDEPEAKKSQKQPQGGMIDGMGGEDVKPAVGSLGAVSRKAAKAKEEAKNFIYPFTVVFSFEYEIKESELDFLSKRLQDFLDNLKAAHPNYEVEYTKEVVSPKGDQIETVVGNGQVVMDKIIELPVELQIKGKLNDEKKANN